MSRAATGDIVAVRAEANVYTVLVVAAFLVQAAGLAIVLYRAHQIGVKLF